jgi:hypothetical protein
VVPAPRVPDTGSVWTHGTAVVTTVGRLFFTVSDGYDGSCTATSAAARGRQRRGRRPSARRGRAHAFNELAG